MRALPAPDRPTPRVLGIDEFWLNETRAHERVHVRQYEHWGPLFIPAYLGAAVAYLMLTVPSGFATGWLERKVAIKR